MHPQPRSSASTERIHELPRLTSVVARPQTNLPAAASPIIGREREISTIVRRLREPGTRLLSLLGPGGVGKTRLALSASAELSRAPLEEPLAGVWFVNLAAVRDPARLPATIAEAIGVREFGGQPIASTLVEVLRGQATLLVLDNLEQVAAGPAVADLLVRCPELTILATSRSPLRIRAERRFPVEALPLPDLTSLGDDAGAEETGAVALFVDRMRAIRPEFAPAPAETRLIAEICVRLDGLPLAIELAAARTNDLTLTALHHRLLTATRDTSLRVLGAGLDDLPDRQRTLRETVAWSHDLLPAPHRTLFRRLAVFAGSFTVDAAATVAALAIPDDIDLGVTEDGLRALADVSLIRREEGSDGDWRYVMLQTVRDAAWERLVAANEVSAAREAQVGYALALAARAEAELVGPEQRRWLRTLDAEQANLDEALDALLDDGRIEAALSLATALWRYWESRGRLSTGRARLESILARAQPDISPEIHAKALNHLGNLVADLGDYAQARDLYEAALALRRGVGDQTGIADSLNNLGLIAASQGSYTAAVASHEESLALRRAAGDRAGEALALSNLGDVAVAQGAAEQGKALHQQALAIRETLGDLRRIAFSQNNLGEALALGGDAEAARGRFTRALAIFEELADPLGVALARHNLGWLDFDAGEPAAAHAGFVAALVARLEQDDIPGAIDSLEALAATFALGDPDSATLAARLFGLTAAVRDRLGLPRSPIARQRSEQTVSRLRRRLSSTAFSSAWEAGPSLSIAAAAVEVTSATFSPDPITRESDTDRDAATPYPAGLSAREVDVLRLVAAGLTNAEIAARLYLSVTTINAHLRRIYPKLNVTSRAGATRFATDHGLV